MHCVVLEVVIRLLLCLTDPGCTYILCMNFVSQTDGNNERTLYHGMSVHDRVCLPFSFAYTREI